MRNDLIDIKKLGKKDRKLEFYETSKVALLFESERWTVTKVREEELKHQRCDFYERLKVAVPGIEYATFIINT